MATGATAIQRIRYGLTGLAFVFLMVLLGTAIVRGGDNDGNAVTANTLTSEPSDPLAELGVAPGERSANEVDGNVAGQSR